MRIAFMVWGVEVVVAGDGFWPSLEDMVLCWVDGDLSYLTFRLLGCL
jgi:hypothetical protein